MLVTLPGPYTTVLGGPIMSFQSTPATSLFPERRRYRGINKPPDITGNIEFAPCPVESLEGPCWIWKRSTDRKGYGRVCVNGKNVTVHRYVWKQTNGPIPIGLVIDHVCRNRACCNVAHLRLVTPKVNSTENANGFAAINAAKTHCKYGHPYDEANTFIYKGRDGRATRHCRTCQRVSAKARELKKKAKQGGPR